MKLATTTHKDLKQISKDNHRMLMADKHFLNGYWGAFDLNAYDFLVYLNRDCLFGAKTLKELLRDRDNE